MKRIILILFLNFFCTLSFFSQVYFKNQVFNPHSAYLEIMGNARFYSVNYEFLFHDYGVKQGIRAGAGVFPNFFIANKPLCIHVTSEYVGFWLGRNHHIEWGGGVTYRYETYTRNSTEKTYQFVPPTDTIPVYINHTYKSTTSGPIITVRLGYRYQDPEGGLLIRAGWIPMFYLMNREKIVYDDQQISNNKLPLIKRMMNFGVSIGWNWW